MATAVLIATRSNCERLHVGCVIVAAGERKNRLVAAGYNGFLPGTPHVSRVRAGHEQATVHAEQNAVAEEMLQVPSRHVPILWADWRIEVVVNATGVSRGEILQRLSKGRMPFEGHDARRGRVAFAWQSPEGPTRLRRGPSVVGQHLQVDTKASQERLQETREPLRGNHDRRTKRRR